MTSFGQDIVGRWLPFVLSPVKRSHAAPWKPLSVGTSAVEFRRAGVAVKVGDQSRNDRALDCAVVPTSYPK